MILSPPPELNEQMPATLMLVDVNAIDHPMKTYVTQRLKFLAEYYYTVAKYVPWQYRPLITRFQEYEAGERAFMEWIDAVSSRIYMKIRSFCFRKMN